MACRQVGCLRKFQGSYGGCERLTQDEWTVFAFTLQVILTAALQLGFEVHTPVRLCSDVSSVRVYDVVNDIVDASPDRRLRFRPNQRESMAPACVSRACH